MLNSRLLSCLLAASMTLAAPAANGIEAVDAVNGTAVSTALSQAQTVAPASNFPNYPAYPQDTDEIPEPLNGGLGAVLQFPGNVELHQQNPDSLAPPTTDHGGVAQAKWPMGLSHNRMHTGGWAREQNLDNLPIAKNIAGVNMRLEAGAVRELHWHTTAEWAYVLKGSTVVTGVNPDGQVFVDTAEEGDLWFFPAGIPHSLQATFDDPDGSEFILAFDDGTFSEASTFQVTDWAAHTPKEVLAKNFQLDISAFDNIPSEQLFIFPAAMPPENSQAPSSPTGTVPNPYVYKLSKDPWIPLSGGSMKIFDTSNFPVADTIVGFIFNVEPGAMRELHWHPTQHEWNFFLSGYARMTLFAARTNARTFDYQAGDVGYVPPCWGHYIENTGNTTMRFLSLFNSDKIEDISLSQWLAVTPPQLVKDHLGLDDEAIASLNKTKQMVIGPS